MNTKKLIRMTFAMIVLATTMPAGTAHANAPAPHVTIAFEFVDESSQPVTPVGLQLVSVSPVLQELVVHHNFGTCDLPGCVEVIEGDARVYVYDFTCRLNRCHTPIETTALVDSMYMVLVPQSTSPLEKALVGVIPGKSVETGEVAGWRVMVTPDGLVITEDADVAARAPVYRSSPYCQVSASPVMFGFAITQVAELLVALLLLLLMRLPLKSIAGVLVAVGLVNFATFPVVWFTFPALGPFRTSHEQAMAVFTLVAALIYAGLLVRLRPAFDPARRAIFVGLLAVALPMVTVLLFGAATVASAAMGAVGAGNVAAAGAGLPYHVTMPASEVFAYTAEALLIALLCRPVLSARQAVLLAVLANSVSLALGLILL